MAEFQAPKPPTSPAEQAANEKKIQNQETITRLRSNVANGAASTLQGKGLIKGSEAKKLTVIISDTLKVLEHERAGQNVSRELAPLINQWNEALGAERAQKALSALRESVGIYTQTTNQIMSNPAIVNNPERLEQAREELGRIGERIGERVGAYIAGDIRTLEQFRNEITDLFNNSQMFQSLHMVISFQDHISTMQGAALVSTLASVRENTDNAVKEKIAELTELVAPVVVAEARQRKREEAELQTVAAAPVTGPQVFAQQLITLDAASAEITTPQEKGHSPEAIKLGKMLAGLYEIATMTPTLLNRQLIACSF